MATTLKAIAAGNTNVATNWQEIATTNIVSIVASTKVVTLAGDVTSTYGAGVKFTLVGTDSATDDGAYVVDSSSLNGSNNTEIITVTAPAADDATSTGTSSINRVPVSTDEIDLNGYSMVQAGGDFEIVAIVDAATGGLFTITDTFTVTGSVTDALLYCNSTVDTISIADWNYSGSGAALDVGASGNITTVSSSSGLDMTSSTGSALTNDNGGTIGTYSVNITNGNSSSAYMIENTGAITDISGTIAANYCIHNNGGTIGDISYTSGQAIYANYDAIYNESGTISDISGGAYANGNIGANYAALRNKGTVTTITGILGTYGATALYNDGGTIGDITGMIVFGGSGSSGIGIQQIGGSIGDVSAVTDAGYGYYGIDISGGSIGDVSITGNNVDRGVYFQGGSIGYLTMSGSFINYAIYNTANGITFTGAVSGSYGYGFVNYPGNPQGVIVDVDFSGSAGNADVYWDSGVGEFTGTSTGGGGSYGAVYVNGGNLTFSGDIVTSGTYGLYIGSYAYGTFNGTVTSTGSYAVENYATQTVINTTINVSSSVIGYRHQAQGGRYSGTLTNTGYGDGIQIYGNGSYIDEISGIVTSTGGTPVNIAAGGIGVVKISGTVSYTPNVPNLSAANILKDTTILGVAGSFDEAARNVDPVAANVRRGVSFKIQDVSKVGTLSTQHSSVG